MARVLLIVGGGIAAYKSLELVRLFKKAGHDVTPVLTKGGEHFVTPMALGVVTGALMASRSISANTFPSRAICLDSTLNITVRLWSLITSATITPTADNAPGAGGAITVGIRNARASSTACNPPAPPNGNNANCRGSWPRSTEM